jgi:hypothetical protein
MRFTRSLCAIPALLFAGFAFTGPPVAAQTLPEDQCAQLEDPEAEITCLRAALAATRQAQQGTNAQTRSAQSAPAPAVSANVQTSPSPPAAPAPDLGSEQLASAAFVEPAPQDREAVVSTITDFRTDRNGRLIVQLENDQIWRQVESLAVPVRFNAEDRVRVEITRSGFGGYRMTFPDLDRRISVSRER